MTSRTIPSRTHRIPRIGRRTRVSTHAVSAGGPRLVPLVFYTMLVVALFFAMIYFRIALDRTAFELDGLERSIALEESRQLDLRLTIAELQDPSRIATEANRIGMTTPDERISIAITGLADTADAASPETPISALPTRRP
jgi:cell division protein FtsL